MRRLLSFLAVLVVLFAVLLSCAAPPTEPLIFAWHGRPEGVAIARAAAREWADTCGRVAFIVDADGAPIPNLISMDEYEGDVLPGSVDSVHVGEELSTAHGPQWIHVLHESDPGYEQAIIAHELGHAFGIAVHAPTGLMAAVLAGDLHVTSYECEQVP